MATARDLQLIPVMTKADRDEIRANIDRLEAVGEDVSGLRAQLAKVKLPDDQVVITMSQQDAIVGACQLRAIVKGLGYRMPEEACELFERLATALLAAEVKNP